jgi:lipoprotein-anchoring transpeptidase ErfK/SrfK
VRLNENGCNLFHPSGVVLLRALLLRFSQAGTIVLTGPCNRKAILCSNGAYLFGLAVVLLAFPLALASAEDLLALPAAAKPLSAGRVATLTPMSIAAQHRAAPDFDAWRGVRYVRPRADDEDDYGFAQPQPPQPRYPQPGPGGGGLLEFLFTPRGPNQNPFGLMPERYQNPYAARGQEIDEEMARPGFDSRFGRQVVSYPTHEKPGTVVIDTRTRYLYLVRGEGQALRYGVGVGRPGFEWRGVKAVSLKKEWPEWRPPKEMLTRRPDLPVYMAGGAQNPLGARAIYLGSSLYRIHGSNEPWTIGTQVSSGCIRMRNEDVIDLYGRVKIGSKVVVI